MKSGTLCLILVIYFGNGWGPGRAKGCKPGFYLTTDRDCIDDNECGGVDDNIVTALCGAHTECYNTPGSYYCTCKKGYINPSGSTNFTNRTNCQDIDECVDTTRVCRSNATCNNTIGGFYCTCAGGFVSNNGELTFTDITKVQCQDIDECLVDPCGPHGICRNTQGSFTCEGAPTQSTTSSPTEIDLIKVDMEQCSLNNSPEAGQSPRSMFHAFCSLINSTNSLINQTWQNQNVALPLQQIISTTNDLLRNDSLWDGMERKERLLSVSIFLQSMEKLAIVAVLHSPGDKLIRNSSENIDLEARVFRGENSSAHDRVSLQAKDTVMDIYRRTVTGGTATGAHVAAVALIAYKNMDSILNGSVFNLSTAGGKPKPFRLISNVVSAVITNRDKHGLDPTVNFTFKHTKEAIRDWTMHCVHWNYAAGKSYWSPSGCTVGASNGTETQCQCNHLSSLALLMTSFKRQDDPLALTVITFIGIPVSLVCLGITFVTFVSCSNLKNAINTTHTQLCASLFLAELLFIVGINRTENRVVCGIVAGFLHYFFLAAFVWMFLEGVQLFLMVRNIRQLRVPHSEKTGRYMYSCGYGVPAVIVVISAAVSHDGYGSSRHCWISTDSGLI
uniref:adhesion G protein-coupled receptor E2-like n=1 Tax=Pristiophorus japonicus TaxID=55135 RepID=UPI00398E9886